MKYKYNLQQDSRQRFDTARSKIKTPNANSYSHYPPPPSPPSAATTTPPPHQYPPRVVSTWSHRSNHTRAPVHSPSHLRQSSSAHPPRPPCHPPTNSPNTHSGRPRPRRRYPDRVASTQTQTSSPTPPAAAPLHSPPMRYSSSATSAYWCSNTPPDISHSPTSRHPATAYSSPGSPRRQ